MMITIIIKSEKSGLMNRYFWLIVSFMISSLVAMDQHQKELSEKEKKTSQTRTNSDQLLENIFPDLMKVATEMAKKYNDQVPPQNIKDAAAKK